MSLLSTNKILRLFIFYHQICSISMSNSYLFFLFRPFNFKIRNTFIFSFFKRRNTFIFKGEQDLHLLMVINKLRPMSLLNLRTNTLVCLFIFDLQVSFLIVTFLGDGFSLKVFTGGGSVNITPFVLRDFLKKKIICFDRQ